MADRQVFLNPTDVLRQMVEALISVAGIPTESLKLLGDALGRQTGFLTADALAKLVSECVVDETQGSAAFSALQNLRPDAIAHVLETVQTWRNANEKNKQRLPDDRYEILQTNLSTLIRDYPALNRMRKANRLRTVLGNEVEGFAFICDARPVYNEARDQIEGMIPVTTLKVVYERQNHDTEEIEFVLTADQLDEFIAKAKKAQDKLTILNARIGEWIPLICVQGEE